MDGHTGPSGNKAMAAAYEPTVTDDDLDMELMVEEFATDSDAAPDASRRRRRFQFRCAAAAAGLLGIAALASSRILPAGTGGSVHTKVGGDVVELQEFPDFQGDVKDDFAAASSFKTSAKSEMSQEMSKLMGEAHGVWNKIKSLPTPAPLPPAPDIVANAQMDAAGEYGTSNEGESLVKLTPKETLGDNNPCADDEELFEGLCYGRCALLTGGMKPVRCAPHICEELGANGKKKCSVSASAVKDFLAEPSYLPCHGYDIGGMQEGSKSCPHTPGVCLTDEELYLGACYKKCSLITNGEYVHRSAMATCCKFESIIQCLWPLYSKTSKDYDVGGGIGDHESDTPATPHSPLASLTR